MHSSRKSLREGMAMSSSGLIRWGGLAGLVDGPLWALTPLREPLLGGRFPEDPVFRPYNLALLVITVVLALGLWALRERYKGSYGRLGTAGGGGGVVRGGLVCFWGGPPGGALL